MGEGDTRRDTMRGMQQHTYAAKNKPSYHIHSESIQHLEAHAVKHYDAHTGQVYDSFNALFGTDILLRKSRDRRVLAHGAAVLIKDHMKASPAPAEGLCRTNVRRKITNGSKAA